MTFVITIVHGTVPFRWLWDGLTRLGLRAPLDPAPWARRAAPLCKGLIEGLPGDVVFSDFHWSGANSAGARAAAAVQLQRHLEDLIRRYPDARHVVVAHSHGGNVALYALHGDTIRTRLHGVVCVSTPFISIIDRAGWLVPAFIALLYVSAVLAIAVAIGVWSTRHWIMSFPGWRRGLTVTIGVVLVAFGLSIRRGIAFVDDMTRSWKKRVVLPDLAWLARDRLLILRGAGDEANSFLALGQFVAWGAGGLIRRAAVFVGTVHDRIERRLRDAKSGVAKATGIAGAAIVLIALSMLAGVILSPVMLAVTFVSVVTWGVRLGLLSPFIELSAESTPPGTWQVTQLQGYERGGWADLFGTELTTLAHSTVYSDARAIKHIVEWISPPGIDAPDRAG